MRRLVIGVVAGMLLPLYPAQANIQTDLNNELSLTTVIENAIEANTELDKILSKLLTNCKDVSDEIICKAGTAESIVSAAVSIFANDADALSAIGTAGIEAGLTEAQLSLIAANNGADITALLPATAAGPGNGNGQGQGQGLTIAPGQTGNAVTPAPFGNNAGGGGGGNASPSA